MSRRVDKGTSETAVIYIVNPGINFGLLNRTLLPCRRWLAETYSVLLQPAVSVLLCGYDLATGHARGENGHAILAGLVASGLRKNRPKIRLSEILRNSSAGPVVCPEGCLSYDMSAFS